MWKFLVFFVVINQFTPGNIIFFSGPPRAGLFSVKILKKFLAI